MSSAPPTTFPIVTKRRLRAHPVQETSAGSWGRNSPSASSVMFATLCSKPAPMKAKRHQKMSTSRAVSSFARIPIHTARQTSMLQSTPRKKRSRAGADILAATIPRTNSFAGALPSTPDAAVASASSADPARLPTKLSAHTFASAPALTVRERAPTVITRLFPVKSSEPAKITSVSATPNEAPITAFVAPEPAACSGAPMAKMRTMPSPTYAPASVDSTRYWRGACRSNPALARAAAAIVAIVSCSIGSSRARLKVHEDPPALDADLVDGDAHLGIVEALPGAQVEALLVDGGGDLRDAAAVADDPAREHECLAEGVEVSQRVDGVVGADDGDLASLDQGADAGVDRDVVQAADVLPPWRCGAHDREWRHPASRCSRCFFSSHPAGLCW